MKFKGFECGGLGVGFGGDGIRVGVAVLMDSEAERAGINGFQGGGYLDGGWFGLGSPLGFDRSSGNVDGDLLDAGGAGGGEG